MIIDNLTSPTTRRFSEVNEQEAGDSDDESNLSKLVVIADRI